MVKRTIAEGEEQRCILESASGVISRLVDSLRVARAQALLSRFSGAAESGYLECRLERDSAQVDLLMAVTGLRRYTLRGALSAAGKHNREMGALQRLVERWISNESALCDALPLLWLEFDDVGGAGDERPNVCVCLEPPYIDPLAPLPDERSPHSVTIALEALESLFGGSCDEWTRDLVRRHILEAPQGAHWIHLSVMLARDPAQLKLYGAFPSAELLPFLERMRWPGDLRQVSRLLERYCPEERTAGTLYVDLPLSGNPGMGCLGINFSQQQLLYSLEKDPTRAALLKLLAKDGVGSPVKEEAFRSWPNVEAVDGWQLSRWLDIKLVCHAGHAIRAKGYLGFGGQRIRQASTFQ